MKSSQPFLAMTLGFIFILTLGMPRASNGAPQHGFRIKEYELFHDVLHPLQHEALPKGDFRRIRTMASELVMRGKAIVKLGVPEVPDQQLRQFAKARGRFDRALARFSNDARKSNDARLKESYTAVHDTFEELLDLALEAYPSRLPLAFTLNCPSTDTGPGKQIPLTANLVEGQFTFTWTISAGKIIAGQGTRLITIDTTDLAGQKVSVNVEARDDGGHTVVGFCEFQVSIN